MINQIDLYCPRKLKLSDYGRVFLTDALVVFCVFCCQQVMNKESD